MEAASIAQGSQRTTTLFQFYKRTNWKVPKDPPSPALFGVMVCLRKPAASQVLQRLGGSSPQHECGAGTAPPLLAVNSSPPLSHKRQTCTVFRVNLPGSLLARMGTQAWGKPCLSLWKIPLLLKFEWLTYRFRPTEGFGTGVFETYTMSGGACASPRKQRSFPDNLCAQFLGWKPSIGRNEILGMCASVLLLTCPETTLLSLAWIAHYNQVPLPYYTHLKFL